MVGLSFSLMIIAIVALSPLSVDAGLRWGVEPMKASLVVEGEEKIRMSYNYIKGAKGEFLSANPGVPSGFGFEQSLSLRAHGTAGNGINLLMNLTNDYGEDRDLSVRLSAPGIEGTLGEYVLGFKDFRYASLNKGVAGLRADLFREGFNLTLSAGKSVGVTARDELIGNGTDGPYILSHRSIVVRTDLVKVDGVKFERDVDYIINYKEGRLFFTYPVPMEAEILVEYEYLQENPEYNRYLIGAGTSIWKKDELDLDLLLVREADGRMFPHVEIPSPGSPRSNTLLALRGVYSPEPSLRLTSELAANSYDFASSTPGSSVEGVAFALSAGFKTEPLTVESRYERVGKEFRTIGREGFSPDSDYLQVKAAYRVTPEAEFFGGFERERRDLERGNGNELKTEEGTNVGVSLSLSEGKVFTLEGGRKDTADLSKGTEERTVFRSIKSEASFIGGKVKGEYRTDELFLQPLAIRKSTIDKYDLSFEKPLGDKVSLNAGYNVTNSFTYTTEKFTRTGVGRVSLTYTPFKELRVGSTYTIKRTTRDGNPSEARSLLFEVRGERLSPLSLAGRYELKGVGSSSSPSPYGDKKALHSFYLNARLGPVPHLKGLSASLKLRKGDYLEREGARL